MYKALTTRCNNLLRQRQMSFQISFERLECCKLMYTLEAY